MTTQHEQLLQHYDELKRLAQARGVSDADAEDLVSETILAACLLLHRGERIDHPKTWLANTLLHKYHDSLRRKYRTPIVANLADCEELSDVPETVLADEKAAWEEETAAVRKRLLYLAQSSREVLIRYYYNRESVFSIAASLHLPEGTVKSRLFAGRQQLKKGLETMKEAKNLHLPGRLGLSFAGSEGAGGRPVSLVEEDLIAQNLLMLAYEAPRSVAELAERMGIPTAYLEPIVQKLADGELLAQAEKDRYYTDFVLYRPEDSVNAFEEQLAFVRDHFEQVWPILQAACDWLKNWPAASALSERQKLKLERYVLLRILQNFQIDCTGIEKPTVFPHRRDGGAWIAMGTVFPAGYNTARYDEVCDYTIWGGHRTGNTTVSSAGVTCRFCEFDTNLWDSPHRFAVCGYETYFSDGGINPLLWSLYRGLSPEAVGVSAGMIEHLPELEELGLVEQRDGLWRTAVPVLHRAEEKALLTKVNEVRDQIDAAIGRDFRSFLRQKALVLPPHLKSVPERFRLLRATECIPMGFLREAYDRGLHLLGVDFCCPPVVLFYEELQ